MMRRREKITLTMAEQDTPGLTDLFASRRYFRKFQGIMAHMFRVAGVMEAEG